MNIIFFVTYAEIALIAIRDIDGVVISRVQTRDTEDMGDMEDVVVKKVRDMAPMEDKEVNVTLMRRNLRTTRSVSNHYKHINKSVYDTAFQ